MDNTPYFAGSMTPIALTPESLEAAYLQMREANAARRDLDLRNHERERVINSINSSFEQHRGSRSIVAPLRQRNIFRAGERFMLGGEPYEVEHDQSPDRVTFTRIYNTTLGEQMGDDLTPTETLGAILREQYHTAPHDEPITNFATVSGTYNSNSIFASTPTDHIWRGGNYVIPTPNTSNEDRYSCGVTPPETDSSLKRSNLRLLRKIIKLTDQRNRLVGDLNPAVTTVDRIVRGLDAELRAYVDQAGN